MNNFLLSLCAFAIAHRGFHIGADMIRDGETWLPPVFFLWHIVIAIWLLRTYWK